jgi:LPXTG-site transpeptidase (sortase) family protein
MFYLMHKRFLSLLTLAALLWNATVPAFAYSDVGGTRYAPAYALLQQKGALDASQPSGRPFDALNRAEALKVLLTLQDRYRTRVDWYRQHLSSLPLFVDLRSTDWFDPYVEAGYEAGIITGYPDRTFRASEGITAEQAIALVMRAYGMPTNGEAGADWYTGYIQAALAKNLVYAGESLYVGQNITRGQFFDLIYRMETINANHQTAFVDPQVQTPVTVTQPSVPANPHPTQPSSSQPAQPAQPASLAQYGSQKAFAITIPKLGITDLSISHPKDTLSSAGLLAVLKTGVGHLFSYPGRGGKIMIYGHSSSYSWDVSKYTKIFSRVNQLKAGDKVYVTYNGTLYVYQVTTQQTISPTDIKPFQGKGEELILFTCWPVGTAKTRLLVHAMPVTTVALR